MFQSTPQTSSRRTAVSTLRLAAAATILVLLVGAAPSLATDDATSTTPTRWSHLDTLSGWWNGLIGDLRGGFGVIVDSATWIKDPNGVRFFERSADLYNPDELDSEPTIDNTTAPASQIMDPNG